MRLGIFGGSFDPVHRGHLVLAESCRQQAQLDRVWFIPAAQQPFKPDGPRTNAVERLAMLELALADYPNFEISRIELERGGTSYTVDTLTNIAALHPSAQLFLLMGADSLVDFPHWKNPQKICQLATPLVVNRAGEPSPNFTPLEAIVSEERLAEIRADQVEMPPMEISSSEIRQLITAGGNWDEFVSVAVATFIREHHLYQ